jgi:hypothetical protein
VPGAAVVVVVSEASGAGSGNATVGVSASAPPSNCCQICAGHEPPVTVMRVVGGCIARSLSGKPTQTAVTSCGVYPTNHASAHSSLVPVLPATGRPIRAFTPVPRVTTCCKTPVIVRAVVWVSTRFWSSGDS